MWAAHEICYEQHLRSMARDSVVWLSSFSAHLQESTRAEMVELLRRDYPDTHQLAAACVSDGFGVVAVADEFWAALPLAHMSDEDIRTIERGVVGLYADRCGDGRAYRGALAASMEKSPPCAEASAPEVAAAPLRVADATPPAQVVLRPAVAPPTRRDSREPSFSPPRGRAGGKGRPCPRRHRKSWSRRRRRRSRSSMLRRPDPRSLRPGSDTLSLRPRSRSRRRR